jgi:hypothetical protein
MDGKNKILEVLEQICTLLKGYSEEHRASTQPFHLDKLRKTFPDYKYVCNDRLVREPLIEHIGSLPVIATTVYPYIDEPGVDLGKALIMLAIHDIGEIKTGDENVFTKDVSSKDVETKYALEILNPYYHDLYIDMQNQGSLTAKFAKTVDKVTPDIIDMLTPAEVTIERYRGMTGKSVSEIVPMIREFKYPYVTWNSFLTELYLVILERIELQLNSHYPLLD